MQQTVHEQYANHTDAARAKRLTHLLKHVASTELKRLGIARIERDDVYALDGHVLTDAELSVLMKEIPVTWS